MSNSILASSLSGDQDIKCALYCKASIFLHSFTNVAESCSEQGLAVVAE